MALVKERNKPKKTAPKSIPAHLVYETLADGTPVYYRGYQEYLNGTKTAEALMGSSYLQGLLISIILENLYKTLPTTYRLMTNELGLQYTKKGWRASDIVIYEKTALQAIPVNDKYMPIPPKIVIEVDTKASFDDITPMDYFSQKTDDLLTFGVEKVIWIFTASRKVMQAEKGKNWIISDWSQDIPLLENIVLNLETLFKENSLQ